MIWFLFVGDMAIMAGMTALAIWLFTRSDGRDAARIPLDDELEGGEEVGEVGVVGVEGVGVGGVGVDDNGGKGVLGDV